MPCYDCRHWRRAKFLGTPNKEPQGHCTKHGHSAHFNYHCRSWTQREISHAEVGLTPAEVEWARAHPTDATVRALSLLFRRIQFQPTSDVARQAFAEALEEWRNSRARSGTSLFGTSE